MTSQAANNLLLLFISSVAADLYIVETESLEKIGNQSTALKINTKS